jgi:hypothetical protein
VGALALGTLAAGPAGAALARTSTVSPLISSASMSINLKLALPGRAVTSLVASGRMDVAHNALALTVTVPEVGKRPHGLAKNQVHLSGGLTFRGEWVGGRAYLTLPASVAALAGGAPSVSIPVTAALRTEITTALTQTAAAVTYAKILLGTLAPAQAQTVVGTKVINGVRAQGTEADLTLSQLLKVVPALTPAMGATVAAMANTEIPVTVWVDRQGRLVEAVMTQPKSATTWIAGTVRVSNLNAPVSISAPAANTVRPISKGELAFLATEDPFGAQG